MYSVNLMRRQEKANEEAGEFKGHSNVTSHNRTMEECEIVRAIKQVCRVASKRSKQLDSFLFH